MFGNKVGHLGRVGSLTLAQRVSAMFSRGEPGAWYDPSDLSTMFQDASGTLPVYAPGQGQVDPPVGLLLDKRLGFALGPERITNTEFQTLNGWTAVRGASATVSGGAVTVTTANPQDWGSVSTPIATEPGKTYLVKVLMTSGNGQNVQLLVSEGAVNHVNITTTGFARNAVGYYSLVFKATKTVHYVWLGASTNTASVGVSSWVAPTVREISANYAYQATTTSRPTLSARYNLLTGTEALATQSVNVVAASYTLRFSGTGFVTLSGAAAGTYSAGLHSITCTAGSLTLTVSGEVSQADLRAANDGVGLPPYQRVLDASTYDTAGFPLYLRFDGVDDALQTGNIDFTSTDKVTAWAGVTKLSDVNTSALLELSPNSSTSAGAIMLRAVDYPGAQEFTAYLRGSAAYAGCVAGAAASPATKVMTGLFNTSAPTGQQVTARLNGITGMQTMTDAGGGMLGNYPLYIGARAGTSMFLNGRLYSLIVRGAQSSLSQIEATELYIKQKMRMP